MGFKSFLSKCKPYLSGVILIALAAASGWYLRNESHFFIVAKTPFSIEIPEGHNQVAAKMKPELIEVLKSVENQNIWRTDIGKIKSRIMESPWIRHVRLQRRFPNEISVHVQLEDIIFNVMGERGWLSVTRAGKVLKASSAGALPDRPLLKDKDLLSSPEKLGLVIGKFLELPNQGALRRENIGDVQWLVTEGLTVSLLKEKVRVHFGHKKIQTKALQVLRVTDYLKSQKQKARVIDASFNKKVLVRLRKRS